MARLRTTDAPPPEERNNKMPLSENVKDQNERQAASERETEYRRNYLISTVLAILLGGALCGTVIVVVDLFFR